MSDLVVKTNKLITALQDLSLVEARLIQLAIIDARETGLGFSKKSPLVITAERYAKAFDIEKANAYKLLVAAEAKIFNRELWFIEDGAEVKTRWLQRTAYRTGTGKIELVFSEDVAENISRIDGTINYFTKYWLKNTSKFQSVYSVRLYELLKQWVSDPKRMPVLKLDVLRKQLGIEPDQYLIISNFKRKVLHYALEEINTYSDITAEYEQVKEGCQIIGFKFWIKKKYEEGSTVLVNGDKPGLTLTDKQRKYFANLLAHRPECEFLANAGEGYEELANFIEQDLLNPERAEFYLPLLEKLKFAQNGNSNH